MSNTQQSTPLHEATTETLRVYAAEHLGIDGARGMGRDDLIARIGQAGHAHVPADIHEPVADDTAAAPDLAPMPAGTPGKAPTVEIIVHEQAGPGGKEAVPVGVNGFLMVIPRNRAAAVPYPYYEALANAVQTSYTETDGGNLVETTSPAYPFQVTRPADPAALRDWKARQQAA